MSSNLEQGSAWWHLWLMTRLLNFYHQYWRGQLRFSIITTYVRSHKVFHYKADFPWSPAPDASFIPASLIPSLDASKVGALLRLELELHLICIQPAALPRKATSYLNMLKVKFWIKKKKKYRHVLPGHITFLDQTIVFLQISTLTVHNCT